MDSIQTGFLRASSIFNQFIFTMQLPPYNTFPVLQNHQVILREIISDDIENILEISYYDSVQSATLRQGIEVNKRINNDYLEGNSIHWGIVDTLTNSLVGTCGYYRGFENKNGELGFVLLAQYRGQGFMFSAMSLAIKFGLEHIGLHKITAITNQQNEKAIDLLLRLQFEQFPKEEGNDLIRFELKDV